MLMSLNLNLTFAHFSLSCSMQVHTESNLVKRGGRKNNHYENIVLLLPPLSISPNLSLTLECTGQLYILKVTLMLGNFVLHKGGYCTQQDM